MITEKPTSPFAPGYKPYPHVDFTPAAYQIGKPPGYYRPDPPPGPTIQEMSKGCATAGCGIFFIGLMLLVCSGLLLLLI